MFVQVGRMNKSKAFTIFEVLISMFILVSAIYVLTNMHLRTLFRIVKDRENLERIYVLKKESYLRYLSPLNQKDSQRINVENPDISITLEAVEMGKNSIFQSMKERLNVIKAAGRWRRNDNSFVQYMPFFVIKNTDEESKESEES
jgi:hypothetical protein